MDDIDAAERVDLDQLDEEYRRRHGVGVEFIKAQVGPGEIYSNAAARAVISPQGAWFECTDLPMEFSGVAGGPVDHRFLRDAEALEILERLHDATAGVTPQNARLFSLFALYTRRGIYDRRGVYAFHFATRSDGPEARPFTVGQYRPETLPLVFKCRVDGDEVVAGLPFQRGVVFCLTGIGELNLVVYIPYEGPDIRDLSNAPVNPTIQ